MSLAWWRMLACISLLCTWSLIVTLWLTGDEGLPVGNWVEVDRGVASVSVVSVTDSGVRMQVCWEDVNQVELCGTVTGQTVWQNDSGIEVVQ